MEYEAWFEALQVAMIFGFGLFVLSNFPSAKNLSYVYFFSAIVVLVLVFLFFHAKVFPLKLKWDFLVWKKYLKMSWPLALVSLSGILYSYTDSVMLGYWNMFAETGWYNAAYKIVMASLVPVGFIGASFPHLLGVLAPQFTVRVSPSTIAFELPSLHLTVIFLLSFEPA